MSQSNSKYRQSREVALWVLYGMDVAERLAVGAVEDFYHIARDLRPELDELWEDTKARVVGVIDKRPKIDEQIQEVSPRWRLERMAAIDRNLLRLGVWEIFDRDTPPIVVINACVELAKEYGEQNTPGFVNGLLDQICKDHDIQVAPDVARDGVEDDS